MSNRPRSDIDVAVTGEGQPVYVRRSSDRVGEDMELKQIKMSRAQVDLTIFQGQQEHAPPWEHRRAAHCTHP